MLKHGYRYTTTVQSLAAALVRQNVLLIQAY